MKPDLETLLQKWRDGDREAGEQVIGLVYSDLRGLAAYFLNKERPGHTLTRKHFETPLGKGALIYAAASTMFGYYLMRKIVNIKLIRVD